MLRRSNKPTGFDALLVAVAEQARSDVRLGSPPLCMAGDDDEERDHPLLDPEFGMAPHRVNECGQELLDYLANHTSAVGGPMEALERLVSR